MAQCTALTRTGAQCAAQALTGSQFCFTHDPNAAGQRAAARQKGGINRKRSVNGSALPTNLDLESAAGLRAATAIALNDLWQVEHGVGWGKVIASLVRVQADVVKTVEIERRLDDITAMLKAKGML